MFKTFWRTPRSLVSLIVALGMLVALSCGPAEEPTPEPTATKAPGAPPVVATPTPTKVAPTPTPTPRSGGTLELAGQIDPPSFDLHQELINTAAQAAMPIFNGLVQYDLDQSDKVIPDLAKSWEVSPDGLVYTFPLQENVRWQDGTPLTSKDVKFSLERIIFPPTGVTSPRKASFGMVSKVEAPDASTVTITLKYASASFLPLLAMGWNVMVPQHVVEREGDLKRSPVGSGPFKLVSWERGVKVTLEKNRDYWKPGLPYLDGVVIYVVPNKTVQTASLMAGRLSMMDPNSAVDAEGVQTIQKSNVADKITIAAFPGLTFRSLWFNLQRKPWSDLPVRQAAHLAMDRQSAEGMLDGLIEPGSLGGFMAPTGIWSLPNDDLMKRPGLRQPKDADLAESLRLMKEAGLEQGFDARLLFRAGSPALEQVAVYIAGELAKLKINVKLDAREQTAYLTAARTGDWDIHFGGANQAINEPDLTLPVIFGTGGGFNYGKYSNPMVDELIKKQSQTLEFKDRYPIVSEIQEILFADMPIAPIYWNQTQFAWWNTIHNVKIPTNGSRNSHARLEQIWMER